MNIILEGVVGSHAYGLNTPESDIDLRGIFQAPTKQVLGLSKPKQVIDSTNPDTCYYELEKFMQLALNANPNILELLWLEEYTKLTFGGQRLIDYRYYFLSKRIMASYGGYAYSQALKLEKRSYEHFSSQTKNRYAKHARHTFRLMEQGRQLLETGQLTIKVQDPAELFAIGEMEPEALVAKFKQEYASFKEIQTLLPDQPNSVAINNLLLELRETNW